jgi:hypothetical protein
LYSTLEEILETQSLLRKVWHDDARRKKEGEAPIFDATARAILLAFFDRVDQALTTKNPIANACRNSAPAGV